MSSEESLELRIKELERVQLEQSATQEEQELYLKDLDARLQRIGKYAKELKKLLVSIKVMVENLRDRKE